jgi:hypothetical protein
VLLYRKAAVIPVPLGTEVFTRILLIRLSIGVVDEYRAELPKLVPVLDAERKTVLKNRPTLFPPATRIPTRLLAPEVAGVFRSLSILLYTFTVAPAAIWIPYTIEVALSPEISHILFLKMLDTAPEAEADANMPVKAEPEFPDIPEITFEYTFCKDALLPPQFKAFT